jgi:selenocysteine lyase/cysteine desulfurase
MLEYYFKQFRDNVIGIDQQFETPYGVRRIVYADWTASGRQYRPIEEKLINEIAPFVGNTHSETSVTGSSMTRAYHKALAIIKEHVHAGPKDVVLSGGSGMTGVVNKFQRILGYKIHEKYKYQIEIVGDEKPIVFVTHMEHHSNHTTWIETVADVVLIPHDARGLVDLKAFELLLDRFKTRKHKVAAVTSCSNVTGIFTPYHELAEIIHARGGLCFVDFACCAPYVPIDMHPAKKAQRLDAIYFSPHKFLGGPGSTGILLFDSALYKNQVPDDPGGGTVDWTNPWGEHKFVDDIEAREDGGTPAFLQTMKAALCIRLKEKMNPGKMLAREEEMLKIIWDGFDTIKNLHVLAGHVRDRLGVVSFYIDGLHYNLAVKMLNDRFGIQVRGGCSCAGTYGHFLLQVDQEYSKNITDKINVGDLSDKPGWVRLSINPVMTDEEIHHIVDAVDQICRNHAGWAKDYHYDSKANVFHHNDHPDLESQLVDGWFGE